MKITHGLILLALNASLASPAAAKVGRVHSENEKDAAMLVMADCLKAAAARFDDGVSPADVVAKATLGLCQSEIDAMIDTHGPFRNERVQRMSREYMREHSVLDTATVIVLRERNKK